MAEQPKAKNKITVKLILVHFFSIAVICFFVAYYYFNWIEEIKGINQYLDAIIRSICILVTASEINRIVNAIADNLKLESAHQKTSIGLIASMIRVAVIVVAIVLVLTLFIEDTSSLFTGIGLLGTVIGIGCNKLIADVVAGIFIILDKVYEVGDTVVISGTKGEIKEVGIRTTKLLDKENNLKIINNSSISNVTNNSVTTSGAMVEIGIEYSEDLDRVEAILKAEVPKLKEKIPTAIAGPFYKGVQDLDDSAVVLRFMAFSTEENRGKTRRAMNRELKKLFDANHIAIAYPSMTVYNQQG